VQGIITGGAAGTSEWPIGRKLATGFAALACFFSFAAFMGWVLDWPNLRSFGVPGRPVWPLTALGYLALSLGFLAAITGRLRTARIIWVLPLLIALISLIENGFGYTVGTDMILFPDDIVKYPFPHSGRPGATPTTIFILLGLAGYTSGRGSWQRNEILSLIASGTLGLATATAILMLFASPDDPLAQLYQISIPSAVVALSLTAAYIMWHSGFGWVQLLTSNRPGWRVLQLLLPAALVFPVLPSLVETALERGGVVSSLSSKLLVVVCNIALVGIITYWAVRSVAREQKALLDAMMDLATSEERLATATAAHEVGVFEWDVASGTFTWTPGTEQRLGVQPGSMPDFESWSALVEPDDLERMLDTVGRAVSERAQRFSYRYRFIQPNGDVRSIEGSSRAFYDGEGNLVRTVGALVNVTERDEREAALRAREAQLRSVLETVPDAMVVIDEQGTIHQFSATAEALWGYRATDVVGRNFTMLSPADGREAYADGLMRSFRGTEGGLARSAPAVGEAADGRRFPLEVRSGLARVDGRLLLTVFFRDISERLAAEERLSDLNAELAHVSRQSAMSELAADLAHELNQPLSATANFLAAARMLIDKGEGLDRIDDMLRMGNEQTQRAGQIIRRLRDFVTRGEVEMQVESIEHTVRDAVELVLMGTGQFDIRVTYDIDAQAPEMYADRIQVQQVIVNLLRNSVEAMRALPRNQRQITITSQKLVNHMIQIEVGDSGPGIPEHILEQLFTRFSSTKVDDGGMGIGLSISKRIIEAHGGMLSAENRPEGGAVFRFTLPAVGEGEE
jgi:two-component system sensor kinase FixL